MPDTVADDLNARLLALTRRVEVLEHRLRDHGWRLRDVVILLERAGDTEVAGYLSELVQRNWRMAMAEHTQGKVRLARMETADELAKLKGVTLAPHEGWFRDNDGSWLVVTDDGRLCTVKFRGTAKRGQAHQAEDPEGLANAKRIVALWNAFEGVETSAIEAGAVAALVRAAVKS
jgi:hypothetical protein